MSLPPVVAPGRLRRQRVNLDPAFACGLFALALGALAVWVSIAPHGFRLSALVRMSQTDPIAEYARFDPEWVYSGAHYDGIYFFAMAIDPLAQGRPHELIDLGANRYGHPAYAWVAGAMARFDGRAVPLTLVLVSLASLYAAGIAASRVASLLGLSPWLGLGIGLNPGLIFAAANDTSEAFGAALLLGVLWAWLSGRIALAGLIIVPLCFAKEHLLLAPAALILWEGIVLARGGSARMFRRRLSCLLPGPALYAVWLVYVHGRFGVWSFAEGENLVLPFPFVGWYESLALAARMAAADFNALQLGTASLALQITVLGAIVLGLVRAVRLPSPVHATFLLIAVLMLYLRWNQVLYPKDLIRGLAFAFVLLPFVLAQPWRGAPTQPTNPSAGAP